MINLMMNPQVVTEPEWRNYGSLIPQYDADGAVILDPETGRPLYYQLPMEQPLFKVRSISTSISIYNGATVVMGGMITEERVAFFDKIPFLGDIPYFGRFFQSKGDRTQKRNLLIFVTARLVDPAGRAVRTAGEEKLSTDVPDTFAGGAVRP